MFGGWGFERGIGLRGPAGAREFSVETSADGRYQIPRPEDLPTGGSMRLRRFTLVVYRRGYVGYRSDFKFATGEARHDFSQRANKVRLEKWQNTLEHRRHLAFLGGGQAIAKAAGWEVQPASLEYEGLSAPRVAEIPGETAAIVAARMLDVSPLLSVEEVRGVTGFAGDFEVGRLMDRVRSDVYGNFNNRGLIPIPESYHRQAIRICFSQQSPERLDFLHQSCMLTHQPVDCLVFWAQLRGLSSACGSILRSGTRAGGGGSCGLLVQNPPCSRSAKV